MANIEKVPQNIDLSQYQNDPELIPIVNAARDEYEKIERAFPGLTKEAFFGAFLVGYVKGINAGIAAVKSINTKLK